MTRWLTRVGSDPDPRFTLANERTFLSWIRTSLALIGAGIAVEAFSVESRGETKVAAMALVIAGMTLTTGAALRWARVERALRLRRTLPAPAMMPVLTTLIIVGGLTLLWCTGR